MADLMHNGCKKVPRALAECEAANDPNDRITAAERRSREEAANFARANLGLSGLKISEETEVLTRRFINGEIELGDVIKLVHDSIQRKSFKPTNQMVQIELVPVSAADRRSEEDWHIYHKGECYGYLCRRDGYAVGISRPPHKGFVEYYTVKSSKEAAIEYARRHIGLLLAAMHR
jgi:hypothetical protein